MKTSILVLVSGLIIITSCNPNYYIPNTQNVPLITQKGETNLTIAGNGNQVEGQGSYGVLNGLAIQVNGGFFIPSNLDNGNGGSGKLIEVGAGYFKLLNNKFVFEAYGIFG